MMVHLALSATLDVLLYHVGRVAERHLCHSWQLTSVMGQFPARYALVLNSGDQTAEFWIQPLASLFQY